MTPPTTGLTPFLIGMLRADPASLGRANHSRLAAKYEIPAPTAAAYLNLYLGRV